MRKPLLLVLLLLSAYFAAFRLSWYLERWTEEREYWISFVSPTGPQPSPPPAEVASSVRLEKFLEGLDQPLCLAYAPGDPAKRLFLVEKTGRIRIAKEGKLLEGAFLDVADKVSGANEQGLLSVAFHPKHAENGRLYVNYTDRKGDTRVVEYRVKPDDPDRVDPESAKDILLVAQPYANHNGGGMAFGPDGKLWVGMGDGGWRDDPLGSGQDDGSLLGKMLRLDVDAPRDALGRAPLEKRVKGVRNPWRFSFDRASGDLYIGDVGQDRYEEVHVLAKGGAGGENLGWNAFEGFHAFRPLARTSKNDPGKVKGRAFVEPVVEYDHQKGVSVTGGHVYRGKEIPALAGCYFFADYASALLRSFRWKEGRVTDYWEWRPVLDPRNKLAALASFGEDEDGELYLLSLDGPVYRFRATKGLR